MKLVLLNQANEPVAEKEIADTTNPPEIAIHKNVAHRLDSWEPEKAEYVEVETIVIP